MKTLKHEKPKLRSSFEASGKLLVSAEEFSRRLSSLPISGLVKKGSAYQIIGPDNCPSSELLIEGNKITFYYFSERSTQKEYAKNLLKFLSILALAREIYEVEMGSIYSSIMEVLAGYLEEMLDNTKRIQNSELLVRRIKVLAEMNCSLSLTALELKSKLQDTKAQNELFVRFSKDVIETALEKTGGKLTDKEIIPKILGTTSEVYKSVLPLSFSGRF